MANRRGFGFLDPPTIDATYSVEGEESRGYDPEYRRALIAERIAADDREFNAAPRITIAGQVKTLEEFLRQHKTTVIVSAVVLAGLWLQATHTPQEAPPRRKRNPRRRRSRKSRSRR